MFLPGGLTDFPDVVDDALGRLTSYAVACGALPPGRPLALEDVAVYSWPQVWSDTSCGFGGIAGQAMTQAQATVFICRLTGAVAVYHAGRFAYLVEDPAPPFWEAFSRYTLPGQHAYLRSPQKWDRAKEEGHVPAAPG